MEDLRRGHHCWYIWTAGLLAQRGFEDTEVLYLKKSNGVFLPLKCGDNTPGYFICNGTKRQFTFKALNSVAKEQAAINRKPAVPQLSGIQ